MYFVAAMQIIAFLVWAIIDAILAAIQLIVAAVGAIIMSNADSLHSSFDHSQVTEYYLLHTSNLYPLQTRLCFTLQCCLVGVAVWSYEVLSLIHI